MGPKPPELKSKHDLGIHKNKELIVDLRTLLGKVAQDIISF
jgi:hypothetical protein